jgi:serine-type D-Ala-D-Ala carboxypeptidase/endopeptidase (penicillin-binding protein 4)
MRKLFFSVSCLLLITFSFAQTINQKIQKAFLQFEKDTQLKHAITSLYIIDSKTGLVVFDKNSQIGLAPASTQKIITSVTAFELLGKDYRYKTKLSYDGKIENGVLNGNLYLTGSTDPTFGSDRWGSTKDEKILKSLIEAVTRKGIKKISGTDFLLVKNFEEPSIPDGWIWQDIGNYYGAGAAFLNWKENQYDIFLHSDIIRGKVAEIIGTNPKLYQNNFHSEVTSAARETGDNAYIYFPFGENNILIKGTIPAGEKNFKISGAIPSPVSEFYKALMDSIKKTKIEANLKMQDFSSRESIRFYILQGLNEIYTHYSPPLDSINYWFLKKSINLYGEALIKTLAYEKNGFGATDSGAVIIKNFWKEKGLDPDELNINDGSGLSPMNRVTAHAQVEILKYAKTKNWFSSFYNALPDYNGMKMKSGTIRDVKGFCGYHTSKAGNDYIFSFLVNNYNGKSGELIQKMYKVLDVLK